MLISEADKFTKWSSLGSYDAVILQKRLLSIGLVKKIRRLSKKLIYDVDDAIWEPHAKKHHWWTRWRTEKRLRTVVDAADVCLVANRHLRDGLMKRSPKARLEVLPMCLDEITWKQREAPKGNGIVRLGWAGAPVNLTYYYQLIPVMLDLSARKNIEWVVYCGAAPKLPDGIRAKHIAFQKGTEAAAVRTFDIGLLPLPNDNFVQGKSPIKALQYMASGVPIVSDPASGAEELMEDSGAGYIVRGTEKWTQVLEHLIDDAAQRAVMGLAAREHFMKKHSSSAIAQRLASLISE